MAIESMDTQDEEAPLVVDVSGGETTKNRTRDVHILSCAFLLIFLAYGAAQNLETTINSVSSFSRLIYFHSIEFKSSYLVEYKRDWSLKFSGIFKRFYNFPELLIFKIFLTIYFLGVSGRKLGNSITRDTVCIICVFLLVCFAGGSSTGVEECCGAGDYWLLVVYSCKFEAYVVIVFQFLNGN